MLSSPKRWHIHSPIDLETERELTDYPPVLRQMLYNRGYRSRESAQRYLFAEQPPGTDPFSILGMPEAIDRLSFAILNKEPIAIYGDYDVDGVTATALLVDFLGTLGAQVQGYIPNRFDEGYGLNKEALSSLNEAGIRLVITVDCGIRSPEEAEHARQLGMDLIITDHHHPGPELPRALAVINPKQSKDIYPDKNLAGVGLAYKLAAGLEIHSGSLPEHLRANEYLDLVALGTVSDLAPLTGENRALVRKGLEAIQQPRRQGILSLIGAAGLLPQRVSASEISYILGPRLNAAGRLESALDAFRLLVTHDVDEASQLAQKLESQNRERQDITRTMQIKAEELAMAGEGEKLLLFAADPGFNPGVVGLVASRLVDLYYRPAIVASHGPEYTRGSCRSIPEFHITEALDRCVDLLEHHGGHAAAAGFTVKNENLPLLVQRLQQVAFEQLSDLDLRPTLTADQEIPLSELRPEILKFLNWLQPTGQGNPQAAFVSRGLHVKQARTVGKDQAHLKLTVSDDRITYDAIAFRQGDWLDRMPPHVDLLYTFEINEYNGRSSLQLNVRDIKPSE